MAHRVPPPRMPPEPVPASPSIPRPAALRRLTLRSPTGSQVEPAVLVVGADESLLPALADALARHHVYVESAPIDSVVDAVVAAAPDLILLIGNAARDCGNDALSRLTSTPQSSVVPVVIIDDNTALDARLRAFRHGAAAVLPRSASIDALAGQIALLAREIPERRGKALGVVGEATLEEFVEALRKQLRTGILSVQPASGGDDEAVRLVLGSGRPLAEFVDEFVSRVRQHVMLAEPLRYEFDERAGGTVQVLDGKAPEATSSSVRDLRLALADKDAARADAVAQELRSHQASVLVMDLYPSELRFTRMRQLDPVILLIGEEHLQGDGYELVQRMRADTRLRWASLLVVRWSEVWAEDSEVPAVERLAGTLAALAEPERGLSDRAEAGTPFDTRLEITGPARCLRALTRVSHPVRMSVHNPRVVVEVDISNGLIVGAEARTVETEPRLLEGPLALSALLVLSSGRVHVAPIQQASKANLMAPVDVALNMAENESPPIAPSLPALGHTVSEGGHVAPPTTTPTDPPPSRKPPRRRKRTGISGRFASALIALAVLQGLIFAGMAYGAQQVLKVNAERAAARADSEAKPEPPSPEALAHQKRTTPSPEAAPTSPAKPEPASDAKETAVTATDDPGGASNVQLADGSGGDAPTCKELLSEEEKSKEPYAGAALQQLKLGHDELVRGDLDASQRAFCRGIAWDADNFNLVQSLAHLLLLRRDGEAALKWARRAVELDPKSSRARGMLGDALIRIGELEKARQAWLAAAGVEADNEKQVAAMNRRDLREAGLSLRKRDYKRAERFYRRVLAFDKDNTSATLGLGIALLRLGDSEPAADWLQRAVDLDDASTEARVAYGDALLKLDREREAKMQWQEALLLNPTDQAAKKRLNSLQ